MKTLFLYSFLFLTISVAHCDEKLFYLLGGGGEPKGETTIFDFETSLLKGGFASQPGSAWKSTYSFNGGHKKTENLVKSILPKATNKGEFLESNFKSIVSDLEKKIDSGELKSGDQIMLMVNTHGAVNMSNESTHSIALTRGEAKNLNSLEGADIVSMDKLEKLSKKASDAGIKMALVDLSCFSGNSLKLANKNVCVISSTGDYQYSTSAARTIGSNDKLEYFGERFISGLKKGNNLEDVFLKARLNTIAEDYPMISTSQGMAVDEILLSAIKPYLKSEFAPANRVLIDYDYQKEKCNNQRVFNELDQRIAQIKDIAKLAGKTIDFSKLKSYIGKYRAIQLKFEKNLGDIYKVGDEAREMIKKNYPDYVKHFEKEDNLSLLSTNRTYSNKYCEDVIAENKNEFMVKYCKKSIEENKMKEKILSEIKTKLGPKYDQSVKNLENLYNDSNATQMADYAGKIGRESKAIYNTLYNIQDKNTKNPCRDFVL